MKLKALKGVLFVLIGMCGLFLTTAPVQALPSFARQTGMSCAACHTVFPELTTYGRTFKLNGYTTVNADQLTDGTRLAINSAPPIAAMMQVADNFSNKNNSSTASSSSDGNGQATFPAQFSLFYAGAISPKMGAFVQMTYDTSTGYIHWDNTDVRLADRFQIANTDLILGLTLNNNPTVQDVFNSVPAWGFPYATTASQPGTSPAINGLGPNAGGLGVYAFWNQLLYAEVAGYRTNPQGTSTPADLQGFSPYWRVALTQDFGKNSVEIGGYGMDQQTYTNGQTTTGTPDNVSDIAIDGQYQYVGDQHIVTWHGSYTWQNDNWGYTFPAGNSSNSTDTFNAFKTDLTYYYDRKIGATVGYFASTGSSDGTYYSSGNGYSNNVPDSQGWVFEANYVPWYNTKFTLQYTLYNKFNGSNGDLGNNALMAMAWFAY